MKIEDLDLQSASEVIPPMTHPYGKVWEQPDLKEISIGVKYAVMTKETLAKLADYSMSQPTGVYEGKMWRSRNFKERKTGLEPIVWLDEYYLHWWGESENPDKCKHNVREILILIPSKRA